LHGRARGASAHHGQRAAPAASIHVVDLEDRLPITAVNAVAQLCAPLALPDLRKIGRLLRPLTDFERSRGSGQMAWAGLSLTPPEDYRQLVRHELRGMAHDGLIEIGSRTMTHSDFACLPAEAQWDEISQSKLTLEQMLQRPVTSCAYPYGSVTPS